MATMMVSTTTTRPCHAAMAMMNGRHYHHHTPSLAPKWAQDTCILSLHIHRFVSCDNSTMLHSCLFTILTNPDHSHLHPPTPNLDLNICGLRLFCLVRTPAMSANSISWYHLIISASTYRNMVQPTLSVVDLITEAISSFIYLLINLSSFVSH